MKKRVVLLVLCLMVALSGMFTGCGKKQEQAAQPSASNGESTQKEPVKLRFTFWGGTNEKKVIEDSLKAFEKKYGYISVEPVYITSDYTAKLTTMLAGNTAPDVGYVSDGSVLPWATDGKFLNLYDFMEKDSEMKKEDILPTAFFDWAPGKCAGLTSAQEGFALMYNKDMFQAAGVELPPTKADEAWDWDKFVEVCKKLTIDESGKNALDPAFNPKKIKQYGFQVDNYIGCWMTAVLSNGGDWLAADGKEFGLSKPEAYEAIQKLADLINVYHVAPSPVTMQSIPDISIALQSKKVAMTLGGNYSLIDFAAQDFNLGIGVFPKLTAGSKTFVLSGATCIFSATKHPEESWLLLKWLENPENSMELQAGGLWMPILKKWYTDPELLKKWTSVSKAHPDGYVNAMVDQVLNNGVASPALNVKNFKEMNNLVTPALDKVWLGEDTAENAMKSIEPKIQPLLQGYYNK